MKNVILSHDDERKVYAVPDEVADHLSEYCIEFCDGWLRHSVEGRKYFDGIGYCYGAEDFIDYLNEYVFPQEPSVLVAKIGWIRRRDEIPKQYRDCPSFNF